MSRTIQEVTEDLSEARRKRIEAHARELVEEMKRQSKGELDEDNCSTHRIIAVEGSTAQ